MKRMLNLLVLLSLLAPMVLATGCGASSAQGASEHNMKLADVSMLPQEMQSAPTTVRESYQFAVANPDALKNVPCYCGCGAMGHTSNYSCYVKQVDEKGTVVYDQHALGCSLCVDITQEVMKLSAQGKSPGEVRQQVVAQFSQFGPPNQ